MSIPARAGEPMMVIPETTGRGSIPARAGGTPTSPIATSGKAGLSPRVRGNRCFGRTRNRGWGSIPARAGEPIPTAPRSWARRVYPRACGGTEKTLIIDTVTEVYPRACGEPFRR